MDMMADFHFLRPLWLWALLPLAALLWLLWRRQLQSGSWRSVVDPRLLTHLLIGRGTQSSHWSLLALSFGGVLAILSLAGPAWRKLEQPVFQQQASLVVLLDLSRSMDAADIKPSRLRRAQLKLRDILNQREEGETALVVYAASPFVVSPLTPDARTIASQVDSLTTDLMPAQGSRPDRAIELAMQLLRQAGAQQGGVLLITDGVDDIEAKASRDAIDRLVAAGYRLSVLGVGTPEGAPIPNAQGGFLKSDAGAIVLPKLDDASLLALANEGRGAYRRLSTNDSDFHALLAPFKTMWAQQQAKKVNDMMSDQWRDEGPWLLLPVLLLAMLAFRRGYLVIILCVVLQPMRPVYASEDSFAWNQVWLRDDQRGEQLLRDKQPQKAAKLFRNPEWRAAAHYRAGDYQAALDDLKGIDGAQASYNRGNAFAQLKQYPQALQAYEDALKRNPKFDDARFNRDLIKKLMQKSPQQGQGDKNDNDKNSQQDQDGKQPQSGENSQAAGQQSDQSQSAQSKSNRQQNDAGKNSDQAKRQGDQHDNDRDQSERSAAARKRDENNAPEEQRKPQAAQQPDSSKQSQDGKPTQVARADDEQAENKLKPADEQWLRRILDDPGGLWRRKFLYQYKQQQDQNRNHGDEQRPW